jgi:hypothetical protein
VPPVQACGEHSPDPSSPEVAFGSSGHHTAAHGLQGPQEGSQLLRSSRGWEVEEHRWLAPSRGPMREFDYLGAHHRAHTKSLAAERGSLAAGAGGTHLGCDSGNHTGLGKAGRYLGDGQGPDCALEVGKCAGIATAWVRFPYQERFAEVPALHPGPPGPFPHSCNPLVA